jgi:hypothetical protein
MCCMNHTSVVSLAGLGALPSDAAQPAANTAITTKHPSWRRTVPPRLVSARLPAQSAIPTAHALPR